MQLATAALPPLGWPSSPAPRLEFPDMEDPGIRICLCSLASLAPAGPFSLHHGRAHRAHASASVPEVRLLRGCSHHLGLPPPAESPQGLARASSSGQDQRSEWKVCEYGVGDTFWKPLTLPSPSHFLLERARKPRQFSPEVPPNRLR